MHVHLSKYSALDLKVWGYCNTFASAMPARIKVSQKPVGGQTYPITSNC